MSKYIIELNSDYAKSIVVFGMMGDKGISAVFKIDELKELTTDYIKEHFSDMQDTAYQKGLADGSLDVKQRVEGAYQRGLDDAWEAARKLFSSMADSDIEKAFPIEWNNGGFNALMNLQPQKAIEKLKAHEQKKVDKIEVGDEVRHKEYKNRFVVTKMQDGRAYGISKDGSWNNFRNEGSLVKTGRHFDIASILEAMKE